MKKTKINIDVIFKLIVLLMLVLKTMLFVCLIKDIEAYTISLSNVSWKYSIIYLAFALFFYAFGYLFSGRKQNIYLISISVIYSIILLLDLWYFRVNGSFYMMKHIIYDGTFNIYGESIIRFKLIDFMFFIDIILLVIWMIIKKIGIDENRSIKKFTISIGLSIVMTLGLYFGTYTFNNSINNYYFSESVQHQEDNIADMSVLGPIGYHIIDAKCTIETSNKKLTSEEEEKVNDWFEYNDEKLPDNEYKGKAKGKNVIFIQLESFENLVINNKVNNQEITPFLNKIAKENIYFNNIYEQNNKGNSIDCDCLVNSSVYTLGDIITSLKYAHNTYDAALPRLLSKEGYETITTHPEKKNSFNWSELHRNSFGVNKLWPIDDYVFEEKIGYYLSDGSYLPQIADKIKDEKEPFFLQMVTGSSHGPFEIPDKYKELKLTDDVSTKHINDYFQSVRYADKQVELFFNKLEECNILQNTMIVIYGDHSGVHKYYDEELQKLDYENNWWKPYDHKIPLIIYGANCGSKVIENAGGQSDIPPTIAYLLGIDKEEYIHRYMGRNLLNTNRNATVIKDKVIKGKPKDEEEEKHLMDAYDIGDLIIRNNYFKK